jgi:hypothetical protein
MSGILEQLSQSPDPQLFATQFNTLMKQRDLVGSKPQGFDSQGGVIPSKDQEKYWKGQMDQWAQYLTAPAEAGGKGMSPYDAKIAAADMARQQSGIDSRYIAAWGAAAGPGDTYGKDGKASETTKVSLGENQPAIAFGPARAAQISPDKVADILRRPEFKTAVKLAEEYKQTSPGIANAKDFAKYVIDRQVGGKLSKAEAAAQQRDQAKSTYSLLKAKFDAGDASVTGEQLEAASIAKAQAEAAYLSLPYHGSGASGKARQDAIDFFTKEAHVFSVAAALQQLY